MFVDFIISIGLPTSAAYPAQPYHIALFVTHLHEKGNKVSSIRSKLSAIAYKHKIQSKHRKCFWN